MPSCPNSVLATRECFDHVALSERSLLTLASSLLGIGVF
jgi:hypothetical protein